VLLPVDGAGHDFRKNDHVREAVGPRVSHDVKRIAFAPEIFDPTGGSSSDRATGCQ
jgi:hypothetical protein